MAFDPEEFAKLMARFDTGNPSDAEAASAARMMRRMVASEGLRFVDVMERADVKKALDAQLQPAREDSAELKEAFGKITELAQALARERDVSTQLRKECDLLRSGSPPPPAPSMPVAGIPAGLVNGWLEAITVALAVVLLIASAVK